MDMPCSFPLGLVLLTLLSCPTLTLGSSVSHVDVHFLEPPAAATTDQGGCTKVKDQTGMPGQNHICYDSEQNAGF
jgi:hypothetical protein